MKKLVFGLILCIKAIMPAHAQDTSYLYFDAYYEQVMLNHPMARYANLLPAMAKAELRSAKGAFDPVLSADLNGKRTKGENSFTYLEPTLKIPTRIGVDVKAGLDQSSGISVSPERSKYSATPSDVFYQLYYAGVSVPLLRGLVTDQRRNQLKQAQLLQGLNEAEQVSTINKLMLASAKAYWDWQMSYARLKFTKENFVLAATRKEYIIKRIFAGEEKPIDSVEAWMEYQRREALLAEAEVDYQNSTLELANYLWDANNNPVQPAPGVIPAAKGSELINLSTDSLQSLKDNAASAHPDIQKLEVKLAQTNLERKLAIENLKPQLNVEYYPFQTYTNGSEDAVDGLFMKNYKFGVSFYSSLFLRKERGKLDLSNYKIKQSALTLQQNRREVQNAVMAAYNNLLTCKQLLEIQTSLVSNAARMRDAEETRFISGESSLFLVNQRERSLLDAQIKLAELTAKYAKAKYQLQWASGTRLF